MRWILAGWCCFTAWIPAQGQDVKTDPRPPRDPAVQRVLDDWINASTQLGPYTAEMTRYTYDETLLEVTVAELQLWAVSTESWRLSSVPSPPVIPAGTTHRANGRLFKVKPAEPFIQLRDHSTYWFSDNSRSRVNDQFYRKRAESFDELLAALQHSENPPKDVDLAVLHFRSLWQSPQFPELLAKNPLKIPPGMLAFPHLYQQTLEECDVQFGAMHESGDPINIVHLEILPTSAAIQAEVERIEILIDPSSSLLKAARIFYPQDLNCEVYVVRSQRRLQPGEYRITPETLRKLSASGIEKIEIAEELYGPAIGKRKPK